MEEANFTFRVIEIIAQTLGYVGVGFIMAGTLIAFLQYLNSVFIKRLTMPAVRLTLGTYILVGLEFMIGQDVVETVINPGFEHLVGLGAVVVIRTVLEYFLGKEVEHLEGEQAHAEHHDAEHGGAHREVWWPERHKGHEVSSPTSAANAASSAAAKALKMSRAKASAQPANDSHQESQATNVVRFSEVMGPRNKSHSRGDVIASSAPHGDATVVHSSSAWATSTPNNPPPLPTTSELRLRHDDSDTKVIKRGPVFMKHRSGYATGAA